MLVVSTGHRIRHCHLYTVKRHVTTSKTAADDDHHNDNHKNKRHNENHKRHSNNNNNNKILSSKRTSPQKKSWASPTEPRDWGCNQASKELEVPSGAFAANEWIGFQRASSWKFHKDVQTPLDCIVMTGNAPYFAQSLGSWNTKWRMQHLWGQILIATGAVFDRKTCRYSLPTILPLKCCQKKSGKICVSQCISCKCYINVKLSHLGMHLAITKNKRPFQSKYWYTGIPL